MLPGSYEGELLCKTHRRTGIYQRHRVTRCTAGDHQRGSVNRREIADPQRVFPVAQHAPTVDFCLAHKPVVRHALLQSCTGIERQIDIEFVRAIGTDGYRRGATYLDTG